MPSYNELNLIYEGGNLRINRNRLTSLAGCPEYITSSIDCGINRLTSLVGGPQKVDGNYYCDCNQLTDLVGCASHIGGELNISNNQIMSLVGIHKIIKKCKLFNCDDWDICEGGIGLLLIENLTNISHSTPPFIIIAKYLGSGTKGMLACRNELIEHGYSDYAKL